MIQKKFITYNLKIKSNAPYPIILVEAILSIERIAMFRYLCIRRYFTTWKPRGFPKLILSLAKIATSSSSGVGTRMPPSMTQLLWGKGGDHLGE